MRSVSPRSAQAFRLDVERYEGSGGKEFFISFVDEDDSIAGFARMRVPGKERIRPELGPSSAVIRELRVYGRLVDVGRRRADGWQHRGFGARLIAEAERMARSELGLEEMIVTSAVGTREYYAKLGYSRKGPYMGKRLAAEPIRV
jgi:elongator complex protein 3